MPTIAERYCHAHRLNAGHFPTAALRDSLTPQARLLYPLLRLLPGYFDADLELIRNVGRQHHLGDFVAECADFRLHPQNSSFLRRHLRLRSSARRLRHVLADALLETSLAGKARQLPAMNGIRAE